MQEMIRVSTHPKFKDLVFRLFDLQGADGIVLSVQPDTKGHVAVGTKGRFGSQEEFKAYLRRSGLQFDSVEVQGWNYCMKQGELMAEFYQLGE